MLEPDAPAPAQAAGVGESLELAQRERGELVRDGLPEQHRIGDPPPREGVHHEAAVVDRRDLEGRFSPGLDDAIDLAEGLVCAVVEQCLEKRKEELKVLERDTGEGPTAEIKRIYRVDLGAFDKEGFLDKTLVCDLLSIADTRDLTSAEDGAVGLADSITAFLTGWTF